MSVQKNQHNLLIDANVLIDYYNADFSIFSLVNEHIASVHILITILEEVKQLTVDDCEKHGLSVISPSFDQLDRAEAAAENGPAVDA